MKTYLEAKLHCFGFDRTLDLALDIFFVQILEM